MTVNPKSHSNGSAAKGKSTARIKERMTADEEGAVAEAYKEIEEGRARTFKNIEEYLKPLDTV